MVDVEKIKANFQLIGTVVNSLRVDNALLEYNERDEGFRSIKVDYKINEISKEAPEEATEEEWYGALDMIVRVGCNIEEKDLKLELSMRGFFTGDAEMPVEMFQKMLKLNGCASMYSIARGIVSSVSSQLFSCGSVTIPMVNFIRFNEIENN